MFLVNSKMRSIELHRPQIQVSEFLKTWYFQKKLKKEKKVKKPCPVMEKVHKKR